MHHLRYDNKLECDSSVANNNHETRCWAEGCTYAPHFSASPNDDNRTRVGSRTILPRCRMYCLLSFVRYSVLCTGSCWCCAYGRDRDKTYAYKKTGVLMMKQESWVHKKKTTHNKHCYRTLAGSRLQGNHNAKPGRTRAIVAHRRLHLVRRWHQSSSSSSSRSNRLPCVFDRADNPDKPS